MFLQLHALFWWPKRIFATSTPEKKQTKLLLHQLLHLFPNLFTRHFFLSSSFQHVLLLRFLKCMGLVLLMWRAGISISNGCKSPAKTKKIFFRILGVIYKYSPSPLFCLPSSSLSYADSSPPSALLMTPGLGCASSCISTSPRRRIICMQHRKPMLSIEDTTNLSIASSLTEIMPDV